MCKELSSGLERNSSADVEIARATQTGAANGGSAARVKWVALRQEGGPCDRALSAGLPGPPTALRQPGPLQLFCAATLGSYSSQATMLVSCFSFHYCTLSNLRMLEYGTCGPSLLWMIE